MIEMLDFWASPVPRPRIWFLTSGAANIGSDMGTGISTHAFSSHLNRCQPAMTWKAMPRAQRWGALFLPNRPSAARCFTWNKGQYSVRSLRTIDGPTSRFGVVLDRRGDAYPRHGVGRRSRRFEFGNGCCFTWNSPADSAFRCTRLALERRR